MLYKKSKYAGLLIRGCGKLNDVLYFFLKHIKMIKQGHILKSICEPYHSCVLKQLRLQYLWFWFILTLFSTILWHCKWNIQLSVNVQLQNLFYILQSLIIRYLCSSASLKVPGSREHMSSRFKYYYQFYSNNPKKRHALYCSYCLLKIHEQDQKTSYSNFIFFILLFKVIHALVHCCLLSERLVRIISTVGLLLPFKGNPMAFSLRPRHLWCRSGDSNWSKPLWHLQRPGETRTVSSIQSRIIFFQARPHSGHQAQPGRGRD